MQAEILIEEANPYKTRVAQVESDGRTIYLYQSPIDDLPGPTHAVWVRNLQTAPEKTDNESMQKGFAPLQKRAACKHPQGSEMLDKSELDLVWFPDGNGVSLYYKGEVEAIIPPFSGLDNIQGYAREALTLDIATLPMPATNSDFFGRLKDNLEFWSRRSKKDYWPGFRDKMLAHLEKSYGKHLQYYALSRDYPPMAIVEFDAGNTFSSDNRIFTSLGMSYQPMPGIEKGNLNVLKHSHMEFVTTGSSDHKQLAGILGRLAVYPWLSGSYFHQGHRYESGMEHDKSAYLFSESFQMAGLPSPGEMIVDDPYSVNWLLAIAVTHEDMLVAQTKGVDFALKKIREGKH